MLGISFDYILSQSNSNGFSLTSERTTPNKALDVKLASCIGRNNGLKTNEPKNRILEILSKVSVIDLDLTSSLGLDNYLASGLLSASFGLEKSLSIFNIESLFKSSRMF